MSKVASREFLVPTKDAGLSETFYVAIIYYNVAGHPTPRNNELRDGVERVFLYKLQFFFVYFLY